MLPGKTVFIWKTSPMLRLLLPLAAGIIVQWYIQVSLFTIISIAGIAVLIYMLLQLLPLFKKYKLAFVSGLLITIILFTTGLIVTYTKDVRHHKNWYGNFYNDSSYFVVRIDEPVSEKTKSYKADGYIEAVINNGNTIKCEGKLLLYFSKDSAVQQLHYGDKILISKKLQAIKNSGNPGAFNYQRYAAFQQTFHNVFLKDKDWKLLKEKSVNAFKQLIFSSRQKVVDILQQNINTGKDELGIAEALLIGYTNDLDKDIIQAYSNTGVVHIIAISGMHLGLIYGLLFWLFPKLPFIKRAKWLQAVLILTFLWLFSLLTGGAASVIRSAVMFTFITGGKFFFKQSSIYNSLAASAFVMLCYNPYYLWDVGFQLSYLAVIGIIIFQRPIYNCLYIKNKWIDIVWQAVSLTTAAQILTFPICIYYFHQFPVLFLVANLIAVPLSTVILYTEIFLVVFSWVPYVSVFTGKITAWAVWCMNKFIEWINNLPFAVWDKIPADIFTTWLLYAVVIFIAAWLLNKNKKLLQVAFSCLVGFIAIHTVIAWQVKHQQKIIVYNVPQHKAIDFVRGNNYQFVGDSILLEDGLLQNFHLKPGRIALQLNHRVDSMQELFQQMNFYQFGNKRVLLIEDGTVFETTPQKIKVDIIVISKNPKLNINQLAQVFNCGCYVFDASNSLWKIDKWKQSCQQLNLQFHSVPEQGAFVLDL
jgi:competence protein ComEC